MWNVNPQTSEINDIERYYSIHLHSLFIILISQILFLDQTIHNLCQWCGSSTLTRDYSAILYVTHFIGTQEYIKFDMVYL